MAIFKDKDNLLCIVCNSRETFSEESSEILSKSDIIVRATIIRMGSAWRDAGSCESLHKVVLVALWLGYNTTFGLLYF